MNNWKLKKKIKLKKLKIYNKKIFNYKKNAKKINN